MISFSRYAFLAMLRDACFVMLTAGLLMVAFREEPRLSVNVAGSVALLFSILLVVRAMYLTEERFLRCEAWLALRVEERPTNAYVRALAREQLQELLLRFAKNAAGIAGLLYGAALLLSFR
jgi:hypothetical protein